MRIIIDLQGAQSTGSRDRGIGRYTLSLAKAIVRNRGTHEIILVLNGLFPETIEPIRADFDALLSQENIRVWYAPGPVNSLETDNNWRRNSAELLREAFIASLKPDITLVTSLFEGLGDDAVTSVGLLNRNTPTATILYDLIPFIHRHPYLENPVVEAWYENKLDHLRRANLHLAISESSRQEGIRYLGFPEGASVNILTAADPQFQPQSIGKKQEDVIRERYNLHRPYVMYTGGIDYRKNIEGLIRAYASLSKSLRSRHQLAVVCSIQPHDKNQLENLAKKYQLKKDELVLTGFIPEDDLLGLYALCKLFVFPSWHEGFGLPALEAMSCGRAVIGANTSSVPEVIGREDALFDPRSDVAIAAKLRQVLTNDAFRAELEQHGLEQAKEFSWDKSAVKAIEAFETLHAKNKLVRKPILSRRPKMAFVSPLPPERSGISDYSAELLPELSRHYDIDVILEQDLVSDPWVNANCQIRNVEWFRSHANLYDRVLYQFGNSHFHQHMFSLLEDIPGIIVLHDFFLSGVVVHADVHGFTPGGWARELYLAHGYNAVRERFHATETADVIWKYPCNLSVLQGAQGVIVHSENSRQLAKRWYASKESDYWAVIPHLRRPVLDLDRAQARDALKISADAFVVCSFGLLNPLKLNHCLLEAWLASDLAKDKQCVLIFVGENNEGEYGQELLSTIQRSSLGKRIRITGWADTETFHQYLAAADIGVQLRTLSRGETSGTVLDCMNYGLPTIVNANGSMADLEDDSVWKLEDEFSDGHLQNALETLWADKGRRIKLGERARNTILNNHAPRTCSTQYFETIERFYYKAATNVHALTSAISKIASNAPSSRDLLQLAATIAKSIPTPLSPRQLLIDISGLVNGKEQHVARNILQEWLNNPPEGLRIEPVYATVNEDYRYARSFTVDFLDCPIDTLIDEPVEYRPGDIFLGLDLHHIVLSQKHFYQQLRRHGVQVQFVVYDLLCILLSQHFLEGFDEMHNQWLEVVAESDGAICISKAVADELGTWLKDYEPERLRPFNISWFHLGADVENSVPSLGIPDDADKVLKAIQGHLSFLMVGTIEPRKAHEQTLAAFEQLWASGTDANLVVVGKQGWMVEGLVKRIRNHPELGRHFFWLEGISDEYLKRVYKASTCLIAASEGEGFGLPIIEAAQHNIPIISRDLPVFREIAGESALYFSGTKPSDLAETIQVWLGLYRLNKHQKSNHIHWITWKESTKKLLEILTHSHT